jgi:hypothetical protein
MLKKLLMILILIGLICSCASIETDPKGRRVIASSNPAPKGCRYLGDVTGNQGNYFTGGWTSNRNLERGARNDMKNEAAKIGANYVEIINSRSGTTGSYNAGFGGSMTETNVTYSGNAYYCPSRLIGL